MPSQSLGPNYRTPFGKNVFLRSTVGLKRDHGTLDASKFPTQTIDSVSQKIAQPGIVLARITGSSKLGPYDNGASDGREIEANIVGILETFLPYQLADRDVEVAYVYDAAVIQERCYELSSGSYVALTTSAAVTALAGGNTNCNIQFLTPSSEL